MLFVCLLQNVGDSGYIISLMPAVCRVAREDIECITGREGCFWVERVQAWKSDRCCPHEMSANPGR